MLSINGSIQNLNKQTKKQAPSHLRFVFFYNLSAHEANRSQSQLSSEFLHLWRQRNTNESKSPSKTVITTLSKPIFVCLLMPSLVYLLLQHISTKQQYRNKSMTTTWVTYCCSYAMLMPTCLCQEYRHIPSLDTKDLRVRRPGR